MPDQVALARVQVQPFGGTLGGATVLGADGRAIPVTVRGGRLTPRTLLTPGERVSVEVTVRRPGWLAWLAGGERRERLSVRAPVASVGDDRWLTLARGDSVRVTFGAPVSVVAYGSVGHLHRHLLAASRRTVALGHFAAAGSLEVAAAARPWETLGAPELVTWFAAGSGAGVVASPISGSKISPAQPLRLTFSAPLASALGTPLPTITAPGQGVWRPADSHTLVFTPSGVGAGLGGHVVVALPRTLALVQSDGSLRRTSQIVWSVAPGSPLRLDQLLAQEGYLPLEWTAGGAAVARTPAAQLDAAVRVPAGRFSWRYADTPPELRALWSAGRSNQIARGALMAFEDAHGLTADGLAGPMVWQALLADAVAGHRTAGGYSYVYVHRNVPQSLNLWHDGHTILSSPGNTGVPAAPTQLGTFAVFEHIPVGTMSGTNPDGSHYDDPGIRYISYFNGGDAIHSFNRASFGSPQSLGCVELPLAAAAQVWPYTPIGTLVTIEA